MGWGLRHSAILISITGKQYYNGKTTQMENTKELVTIFYGIIKCILVRSNLVIGSDGFESQYFIFNSLVIYATDRI